MNFKLTEGKQVGRLMYMVESPTTMYNIIEDGCIKSLGKHPEFNPDTHVKSNMFICFARTNLPADRAPKRWIYGVTLDGDKLSDRYSIRPYSFKENNRNPVAVSYLTAYDDGTYYLSLTNFGGFYVPKDVYDFVEDAIINMPESDKIKKGLEISTGKRAIRGRKFIKKYAFHGIHGGVKIKPDAQPTLKTMWDSRMDETEERIWLAKGNSININGCMTGIIMPKREDYTYEEQQLIDLADSMHLDIRYYDNKYLK